MWHDGWHSFLWVWVSACQKIPSSVLSRNPHKGLAREISHETGRGRGKEGPKENRKGVSQEKWTEQSSRQKSGVADGRERWRLEPVDSDAGLANIWRWVSIPGDFVEILLEYTLVLAHRNTECSKVSETSPFLRLELTQARDCLFFFSSTLSVAYIVGCVSIKKCEIPPTRDVKNHWTI